MYTTGWTETMWNKVSCLKKQHNGQWDKSITLLAQVLC